MSWTLAEIVKQLRSCAYECEAGSLANNVAFVALEQMSQQFSQWEPVPDGTHRGSDPQMADSAIRGRTVTQRIHGYVTGVLLPEDWRVCRRTTAQEAQPAVTCLDSDYVPPDETPDQREARHMQTLQSYSETMGLE